MKDTHAVMLNDEMLDIGHSNEETKLPVSSYSQTIRWDEENMPVIRHPNITRP